jgi:hypothetical protein
VAARREYAARALDGAAALLDEAIWIPGAAGRKVSAWLRSLAVCERGEGDRGMTWTTNPPDRPGWWWFKYADGTVTIVRVYEEEGILAVEQDLGGGNGCATVPLAWDARYRPSGIKGRPSPQWQPVQEPV